jgi:hypothetical protein
VGDRPLELAAVEQWIEERRIEDGEPSLWIEVPISEAPGQWWQLDTETWRDSVEFKPPLEVRRVEFGGTPYRPGYGHRTLRFISYSISASGFPMEASCLTSAGGLLEELREISEELSRHYLWHPAQATMFVLTAAVPSVPWFSIKYSLGFPTAVSRVELTIDPAMSPVEVAAEYRRIRQSVVKGRPRALSEKHLQLASFTADMEESDPWEARRTGWNKEYPRWRYDDLNNFRRDCRQAAKRLLWPDFRTELEAAQRYGGVRRND